MTIAAGQPAASADILKHSTADGYLQLTDSTELTIASGAVTVTANFYRVDTESNASTDDLDTITAGTGVGDGHVLVLRPESTARTVVIKHNAGNIMCPNESDISLDDSHDAILLLYDGNLTKWMVVGQVRQSRTRRFLVPTPYSYNETAGTWLASAANLQGASMPDAAITTVYAQFYVPEDFASGMTVSAIVATTSSSGDVRMDGAANYGAVGETPSNHTATFGGTTTVAVTTALAKVCTITLSSAAKGDYVGVSIFRDGTDGADTLTTALRIKGFLVEYTADS